jgi:hypothetical protein
MTRPRAADDFAMIRARMEELHRERAPAPVEPLARPEPPRACPKPNVPATRTASSPAATTSVSRKHAAWAAGSSVWVG